MRLTVWDFVDGYVIEVAFHRAGVQLHFGIAVEILEKLAFACTAKKIFVAVDAPSRSI